MKLDRITVDPRHMNGQPCIRGMQLTVKRLLLGLTQSADWDVLVKEYPNIESEDVLQSILLAANKLGAAEID